MPPPPLVAWEGIFARTSDSIVGKLWRMTSQISVVFCPNVGNLSILCGSYLLASCMDCGPQYNLGQHSTDISCILTSRFIAMDRLLRTTRD